MRERTYVKFRVDMLSDTKSKIIDTKPERDLIHYVWMAIVLLAGRVNLAGELYLSKNIPYTIETLAIEFGREIEQVKLALDVLIELEMIELTEHNIYIVKNFAKHQNIKVKEEEKLKDNQEHIKNEEAEVKEEIFNKALEIKDDIDKNKIKKVQNDPVINLIRIEDNNDKGIEEGAKSQTMDNNPDKDNIFDNDNYKNNANCQKEEVNSGPEDNIQILSERKKRKKAYKKKNSIINVVDEEKEEEPLLQFFDGDVEIPLREGERVIGHWHF